MEKGNKFWKFISYLFHPALMPTLGTFVVMWNDPFLYNPINTAYVWLMILIVVLLCTYILPLLLCFVLFKANKISSISNPTENDRRIIIGFTAICYILAYYSFRDLPDFAKALKIFMLGINITIIATFLTCFFTRISFHSVGVGGLLGTIMGLIYYEQLNLYNWLIIALIILILTTLSRYKLKAHDAFNIYVGLIIGITTQALVFMLNTPRI